MFDLDSDGKAEVLLRTFEGVTFADGKIIPASAERAQYVSVVDGLTGIEAARTTITNDYAADGPLSGHFGIAYLDGEHPSLITALKNRALSRNFQYVTSAYDYAGGALNERWRHTGADGEFSIRFAYLISMRMERTRFHLAAGHSMIMGKRYIVYLV